MSSKTFNYKQYSDRRYALSPDVIEEFIGYVHLLLKPLEDNHYLGTIRLDEDTVLKTVGQLMPLGFESPGLRF